MKVNLRVSGIIKKDNKLLVVKHENKFNGEYYLLPGGGLEFYESIEECAIREVKEETGLDSKIKKFAFYEDVISKEDHTLHLIFNCEVTGGRIENLDPDKKVKEIMFVSKEELIKLKFFPKKLKSIIFEYNTEGAISLGITPFPDNRKE